MVTTDTNDKSVLTIGDLHEKRELAIYNDPSYSYSGALIYRCFVATSLVCKPYVEFL